MDWGGAAAVWQTITGWLAVPPFVMPFVVALPREPGSVIAAIAVLLLLALALWQAIRVRQLKRRLAADTGPARTLFQAVVATREARTKAAGATLPVTATAGALPAAPGAGTTARVKIYVDYSNLVLNWRNLDAGGVDWDLLPVLVLETVAQRPLAAARRLIYSGMHVYGSYYSEDYYDLLEAIEHGTADRIALPFFHHDRATRLRAAADKKIAAETPDRDKVIDAAVRAMILDKIADWRTHNHATRELLGRTLAHKFGVVSFPFERRTPRSLPSADHNGNGVPIAEEKGLDIQVCTDLMADGAANLFDIAVVVSNDSDFVPAIRFVDAELGKPVFQLGPQAHSHVIRTACRGAIDLEQIVTAVKKSRTAPITPAMARTPAPSR